MQDVESELLRLKQENEALKRQLELLQSGNAVDEVNRRLRILTAVLDQSPVSIVLTDRDGNIEYANPHALKTTGYQIDELKGKNPRLFQSGNTELTEYQNLWNTVLQGEVWHGTMINKKKNGDLYWESSVISPLKDEHNNITHLLAIKDDVTKRVEAEEKLKLYKNIVDQEYAGSAVADLDGILVFCNEYFAQIHGYSVDELIGKNISIFHTPDQLPVIYELLNEVKEFGGFQNKEVEHVKKDGEVFTTLMSVNLLKSEKSGEGYMIASAIDISDKIHYEKLLREQKEQFKSVVEAIPDIIFRINAAGDILEYYASETQRNYIKETTGLSEFRGYNLHQIFLSHNAELHLSKISECLHEKNQINYEANVRFPDEVKIFDIRLIPFHDSEVFCFARDISLQKKNESELHRLSLAVIQSPVAVVITDLAGNVEYVNPAFERISGYSQVEIAGQNIRIVKSGLTDVNVYRELWSSITEGRVWSGEWINKRKNGELYWESVSISPVFDASGQVVNFLSVKQDITQKKKFETEVIELNANLEAKVKQRTVEIEAINEELLTEIEFRKSIEEALTEKTNELKNFFDVALDLLCIADIEGRFLKVNKEWSHTLGYTVDELENHLFLDFVHPDDLEATLEAISKLGKNEPIFNFTNRYRTVDGEYKYIEWRSMPLENRIYAAARDISERKLKEIFVQELLDFYVEITLFKQNEFDKAVDKALMKIGQYLDTDRAFVFEYHQDAEFMSNTYEWCHEGIEPQIDNLKDLPINIFPESQKRLELHENVLIHDVDSLPDEWQAEREILQMQGIKTLLIMPMFMENKLAGFIGLDSVRSHRKYTESEINILNIWGNLITGLISSYNTEKILENTRKNFEIFFNTIDDFLWVVNPDGRIVHVNNTVTNRLQLSRSEIIGRHLVDIHPQDKQEQTKEVFGNMLCAKTDSCRLPLVTSTQKLIPVETRVKFGEWDGQPAIFGVSKDITVLELSEEKFSKAFQSGSAMMAISNFETGEYIDVNATFLKILGYKYEEVIGRNSTILNLFVDKNTRKKNIKRILKGEEIRDSELKVRTRTGEIKTILLSADTITINNNLCLLTIAVDISERKKFENMLMVARTEAEKANFAKSEFLSRMSHELRTPLNSILGFAQLLEISELDENQERGVYYILQSGRHLLGLINDVLNLSKIEAGKISMSIETVDLVRLLKEVADMFAPQVKARNITCKLQYSKDENVYVLADLQSLKQVIINLIDNAIKYNVQGGEISIWIDKNSENDVVRFFVKDTGIGIASEEITTLFDPFVRFVSDTSEIEGTGLGLTLVKKLVDLMDGNVGVESKLNQGSIFWVDLKAGVYTETRDEIAEVSIKELIQKVSVRNGSTVLYIEDNISNIELMKQIVNNFSEEVELVVETSGLKSVPLAMECQPDLILLDLNLPDVHGSEVLRKLKANTHTNAFPVVIISADAMPKQAERLLKLGADEYITKPISLSKMKDLFDKYLH